MKKNVVLVAFLIAFSLPIFAKLSSDKYVDSVFASLTDEERIAQLMIVTAYSTGDIVHEKELEEIIKKYKVGGLIFFQGSPEHQVVLTNHYQQISQTPLLILMDAEWGVGMRLDSAVDLPYQIMLGAMQDASPVYDYAKIIANQCKRLGVHFNLAPVIDVNNNPKNPIIGYRSFGENVDKVSEFGVQYIKGLQDNGVYAAAKHFPGHGDVDVDSHEDLPVLQKSRMDLESLEFIPFYKAVQDANVKSVLVAHLSLPKIINKRKTPSSISQEIISDILIKQLKFNGLVITDALNMRGLKKFVEDDEVALKTLRAGNDLLCMPDNVQFALLSVKKAMTEDANFKQEIYKKVKKVLLAKYDLEINQSKPIAIEKINEDLNKWTSTNFMATLVSNASTLVRLRDRDLFKKKYKKTVYISIGEKLPNRLSFLLSKNSSVDYLEFDQADSKSDVRELYNIYKKKDDNILYIIGLHNYSNSIKNDFGITKQINFLIEKMSSLPNSLVVFFGNPYILKNFPESPNVLLMYNNSFEAQSFVADIVTENVYAKGVLPVSIDQNLPYNTNVTSFDINFKTSGNPQNDTSLSKIDALVYASIEDKVFPGCQIVVTHKDKVVYQKNFGTYTYNVNEKVNSNSIFDIASLTKVFSTTLAIMKLYENGQLKLNDPLSKFLPQLKKSNKGKLTIKELLAHQSGLISWIPFYKETLDERGNPSSNIYQQQKAYPFTIPIAQNLYMHYAWKDSLMQTIINSKLSVDAKYVYSDLGFVLLAQVVNAITNMNIEDYVKINFYDPLGLGNTYSNPINKRVLADIVPTEQESIFRNQLIRGYVHDYTAAMLGGFTGNAGLFSNATDITMLCKLLLNGGVVGRNVLLKESTIKTFTNYVGKSSRRGLGFDKPEHDESITYPSKYSNKSTYGHTGFTGTCAWVDPKNDLTFVFLSNRIYPSSENKKIQTQKTREKILDIVYEEIINPNSKNKATSRK